MKEVNSNGLDHIVSQAIEEMKREQGDNFSLEKINLAELGRRTGLTRARLRKLKRDGFMVKPHGLLDRKASQTVLTGYTVILDKLLVQGITNAQVCLERLQEAGFPGSLSTVKDYIATHRFLVPAKRQMVAPQGTAVAAGSLPSREKPSRWTGVSPMWLTMTEANTRQPASP